MRFLFQKSLNNKILKLNRPCSYSTVVSGRVAAPIIQTLCEPHSDSFKENYTGMKRLIEQLNERVQYVTSGKNSFLSIQ
jgi:hypothetical protein